MKRIVVTGLGMVSPVGLNVRDSWQKALLGETAVDFITSCPTEHIPVRIAAEVKGFDPETVFPAKEARQSSRFVQLAVAAAKEALIDANLISSTNSHIPESLSNQIGTSIGVGIGAIGETTESAVTLRSKGYKRISPFFLPYTIPNMAAGVVANTFGLKGPNLCSSTACTSGTHAISEAYMMIQSGFADVMVCGGAEAAICDLTIASFAVMRALSTDNDSPKRASRPFDKTRDGFVLGEGSGLLVLEDYEHAKKRGATIYAELVGFGFSADAHHITAPAPEGEGARRCMEAALRYSKIAKEDVGYINAHGTSTKLNDLYESMAIRHVFKDHAARLMVSSTKGVTGHCLGAAGGIEAVFTVKALQEKRIPMTAGLLEVDPECGLDYVPQESRERACRYAMSNSFGFGGTNGSLIFKAMS